MFRKDIHIHNHLFYMKLTIVLVNDIRCYLKLPFFISSDYIWYWSMTFEGIFESQKYNTFSINSICVYVFQGSFNAGTISGHQPSVVISREHIFHLKQPLPQLVLI